MFACFDKDSSGAVTTAELALVLKSMNKHYTDEELQRIISKFDVNGDGPSRTQQRCSRSMRNTEIPATVTS